MYGYECQECDDGIVKEDIKTNYKTKISGVDFIVPKAKIGVCNSCGTVNYHGKELKRWRKLFELRKVKSKKYLSPKRIKRIREVLGMNQSIFAEFIGISRQALGAWESYTRKQVQPLNMDILFQILFREIKSDFKPVTTSLLTEYERRSCQESTKRKELRFIEKTGMLREVLPTATWDHLVESAQENNSDPVTETVRAIETLHGGKMVFKEYIRITKTSMASVMPQKLEVGEWDKKIGLKSPMRYFINTLPSSIERDLTVSERSSYGTY